MTTAVDPRQGSGDWPHTGNRNHPATDGNRFNSASVQGQEEPSSHSDRAARPLSGIVSLSGSTPSILPTSEESFRMESSATGEDSFPSSASSSNPSTGGTVSKDTLAVGGAGTIKHSDQNAESGAAALAPEDLHARIEKKRIEHEQQRALQRKAFEQQMLLLEMQQQEEERNLLQQQQHKDRAERDSRDQMQLNAAVGGTTVASSTPSTPLRESNAGASGARQQQQQMDVRQKMEARPHGPTILGSVPSHTEPEEGLNGSNVPGLAPSASSINYHRSMPASRRQSQDGHLDVVASGRLAASLANQRRTTPQQELSNAFDKMTLTTGPGVRGGLAAAHLRSQVAQQDGSLTASLDSLTASQHSALQRALARSGGSDAALQALANPQSSQAQQQLQQQNSSEGFTPVFNERFLFDDELDSEDSAFVKRYNLQEDDDKFPILVRRDSFPDVLSASSAALDLAPLSQAVKTAHGSGISGETPEWPPFGSSGVKDRSSRMGQGESGNGNNVEANIHSSGVDAAARRSVGPSERASPSGNGSRGAGGNPYPLPSPSPCVSQTGRNSPAVHVGFHASSSNPRSVSTVAAPVSPSPVGTGANGMANGSRFAGRMGQHDFISHNEFDPLQPQPHGAGGAARDTSSFPSFSLGAFSNTTSGSESPSRFGPYSPAAFDADSSGRAGSNSSRPNSGFFDAFNPTVTAANAHHHHPVFGPAAGLPVAAGGPPSLKHARKGGNGGGGGGELDAGTRLEDLQGEIFALCKDQHGCRYLQKKLEEGLPSHRDMIFAETFHHFAELMTDPFGNYLCQKMLEYCTDEQRNRIVESVAPELVTISLNMHGTRAVQKTIDFLSTSRQIHSIIMALSMNVVTLIKDLNGNHVIQKCLNRLGAEDNQFIYNAVAAHCVEVATHRHGCCVLQRCIDHASDSQRIQLVAEITYNALTLVQDPFGNYVVQYVLDLCDPRFTDAVIRQFVGNVCLLSVQKFSSNVIEKCIRVSDPSIRKQLIEELLNRSKLEKLLRDSFANYVVQTALDYADPVQRMRLVECIRPILPVIRNTPYGKRIQSKLQRDNLDLGPQSSTGGGGLPFSLLQQAAQHHHHQHQHQQLQAMAAMAANRQAQGGIPADYLGLNAYGQPAMQPLPPPLHHYPQPPPHQPASQLGGRQHQLPPHLQQPQHHHHQLYGGGGGQHSQGHGAAAGGLPHHHHHPNTNHNLPPPMNFVAPSPHAVYGGINHFQGPAPPPPPQMGVHGASSGGFPTSSSGGFGPY
ncbi:hypothetical protein ACQY0O_007384 [Thecaphora frezii]